MIAAEDTRHSKRLLEAYGIHTPLQALHEHNEQKKAEQLIDQLSAGRHIALITDAGTPAISDPGARLVAQVRAAGFPVIPVPGPCALIAALSVSGFICEDGFRFIGFLPPKQTARQKLLEQLRDESAVLVFYEAPHRILECITDLTAILGKDRQLLVARELTKLHEEIASVPLSEAHSWFTQDSNRQRGEFVLAVTGAIKKDGGLSADEERILGLLLAEMPVKTAVKLAAQITGAARNTLYDRALEARREPPYN